MSCFSGRSDDVFADLAGNPRGGYEVFGFVRVMESPDAVIVSISRGNVF